MTQIQQDWVQNPATQRVFDVLKRGGHQAYFVGGCVRNALLGAPVSDLDVATDATPDQVLALAEQAGLKAVATGYDHGTVTVVSGDIAHEITTFRRDVETDGRRAVVAYSDNIAEDARRRDFTMNALYADAQGQVLDPLGGLADLQAGRVRFIEDARQRIKEDYLRSLRFFRFHAWYGDPAGGLDAEALAAIAANLPGLETLSKERVGSEMMKLLAASDPAPAVAAMETTGMLAIFLPGATARPLPILIDAETDVAPNAIRRLAVLGGQEVAENLRLSRADTKRLEQLHDGLENGRSIEELGYRQGIEIARDVALLRAAIFETPLEPDFQEQARAGADRRFPVQAKDLMPELSGPELGQRLQALEDQWIRSDFRLTRRELLS